MTDHQVTDLSYGHLGKAIYDLEDNAWNFSVDTGEEYRIQQLQDFQECISPSSPNEPEDERTLAPSLVAKIQVRRLLRSYPEAFSANEVIANSLKAPAAIHATAIVHEGSLLAAGRAVDIDRISGSRRPQILATPFGGSGHILQLIKPRSEIRGWRDRRGARLSVLNPSSFETGFWVGTGGTIRQIAFASDENWPGTWLATRQDSVTTIFRPLYGKLHEFPRLPTEQTKTPSSSMLDPNPVAQLTIERTKSRCHVDFSFNPWYARQFAVIDDLGLWSVWDLDRSHDKGTSHVLIPGRKGSIYDVQSQDIRDSNEASIRHADGWYKILWACNISTIVVCNRRSIAVFDIKAKPERLTSPDIFPPKNSDWILDIVRSTKDLNHLFVLTTSRLYWIEVVPVVEDRNGEDGFVGARVLLSYRHFRSPDDETMRLTVLDNENISVTLTSSTSYFVDFYSFRKAESSSATSNSRQGSFSISFREGETKQQAPLRSLLFLPCTFVSDDIYQQNVQYFQLWALTSSLGLDAALCQIHLMEPGEDLSESLLLMAPDRKISHLSRGRWRKKIDKRRFVLNDSNSESEENYTNHRYLAKFEVKDDFRFRLNWRSVFEHVFAHQVPSLEISNDIHSMPELLSKVTRNIASGLENQMLPMDTIANISGFTRSSGELDQAASALRDFLSSLDLDFQAPDEQHALALSHLTYCPEIRDFISTDSENVDLSNVHQKLVSYWMTSLPLEIPNPARLAKFKIIRQLGVDLALNSFGISLRKKSSSVSNAPLNPGHDDEHEKDNHAFTRDSSPALFSSLPNSLPGNDFYSSLLTPSQPPSLYSHATSRSELKEDPVTSRLRQYAVAIKARPDAGKSSLLSHWSSIPNVDPSTYSYEAAQKVAAAAAESDAESKYRNRKEEARRRRRTEKFLLQDRSRARVVEANPQPMVVLPSGTQPEVSRPAFSSQVMSELPMTQPDRGTFGSRTAQKGTKQKRQRKAGF